SFSGTGGCVRRSVFRLRLTFFSFRRVENCEAFSTCWGAGDYVRRHAFLGPSYRFRLARRLTFFSRRSAGPKKSKQKRLALHSGLTARDSPHSIHIPGAGVQGPSMSLYASLGIHAARSPPRGLRSAF